jgi:DNA replication and repair protein RecF
MALTELQVTDFRCISSARLAPGPGLNLLCGANGAGKTSLLEGVFLLGRGRSFRAPRLSGAIRRGQEAAVLFGMVSHDGAVSRLGLRLDRNGAQIQVDGRASATAADLVAALPVQFIDPGVHVLVEGGPGERRRFLDWGVFHVKHEFLDGWRRFRRALQQRNAALRQGAPERDVRAWDDDLAAAGEIVDDARRAYLEELKPEVGQVAGALLPLECALEYRPGWDASQGLAEALRASAARDRAMGATQVGPHRAEIILRADDSAARHRLSRGQQKLLGAALILAQTRCVGRHLDRAPLLLVDEPAAELDGGNLARLLEAVAASSAQVFLTALGPDALPIPGPAQTFHVEHGEVRALV